MPPTGSPNPQDKVSATGTPSPQDKVSATGSPGPQDGSDTDTVSSEDEAANNNATVESEPNTERSEVKEESVPRHSAEIVADNESVRRPPIDHSFKLYRESTGRYIFFFFHIRPDNFLSLNV